MRTLSRTLAKVLRKARDGASRAGGGRLHGERPRERAWWAIAAAVGGLLLAILAAGLLGLFLNLGVQRAADEASYDVELEDHGDDLRVAVLDLRQYHRNLLFYTPTDQRIAEFEEGYDDLLQEIDELEAVGVNAPGIPKAPEIRATAETYYEDFRPAIDRYGSDSRERERACGPGLERIEEMEAAASRIDDYAERRTEDELGMVDRASTRSTVLLISAVGALLVTGAALAFLALRVVNELRRLYAEQKAAARAKTDFLADVSHELRTPLTVLKGNAEVGLALDEQWPHRYVLEEISHESSRMAELVEDLLFLARSDSAAPVEMQAVPVKDFLEEISSRATSLARERGARLLTELSGEGELRMDRRRLAQAILILVDNAAKYGVKQSAGEPGESDGTIRLSSRLAAGEFLIEVSDDGPGIPEEELPRIFERFYRVDKVRSRSMGGTGLGLPIAKTIVEAHEGRMEAESSPGKGTVMRVRIPASSA